MNPNPIKINTGTVHIPIERDGEVVGNINFNPEDIAFVERFDKARAELKAKFEELRIRAEAIDADPSLDEDNLPANLPERVAFMREVAQFARDQIDHLFGSGTSQMAFGDVYKLNVIEQFFGGIAEVIQSSRSVKVKKYTQKPSGRVMR